MHNFKNMFRHLLLSCFMMLLSCNIVSAEQVIALKIATNLPATHWATLELQEFAASVGASTNHSINVLVYSNRSFPTTKTLDKAVMSGEADMTLETIGRWAVSNPVLNVIDLPFLFDNHAQYDKALDGKFGKLLGNEFTKFGVTPLAWMDYDFVQLANNVKEIKMPYDMAGMRLRSYSRFSTLTANACGANNILLPSGEIYAATTARHIDGCYSGVAPMRARNFQNLYKYYTILNQVMPGFVLAINSDYFNRLNTSQQEAIKEAAKKFQYNTRIHAAKTQERATEEFVKAGCNVHYLTAEERAAFRKTTAPVIARYIQDNGPAGQQLLESLKK